jgi:hypothetical protein
MGWSPLHLAAMEGRVGLIERLVAEHGCGVAARSANSWTPLHYAAAHNRVRPSRTVNIPCMQQATCMVCTSSGWA